MSSIQYKGYTGSVEYDSDATILFGKILFIKALVTYEASDAAGIKKAFHDAVDDYLQVCEQEGIEAEQPFKGSFNVRTGHELHRALAMAAEKESVSLNKYVCKVLSRAAKGFKG